MAASGLKWVSRGKSSTESLHSWLKKSSLAARREGDGMNMALLKHLPMKLDSLILGGALREGCRVVRVCEGAGSTSTQS